MKFVWLIQWKIPEMSWVSFCSNKSEMLRLKRMSDFIYWHLNKFSMKLASGYWFSETHRQNNINNFWGAKTTQQFRQLRKRTFHRAQHVLRLFPNQLQPWPIYEQPFFTTEKLPISLTKQKMRFDIRITTSFRVISAFEQSGCSTFTLYV